MKKPFWGLFMGMILGFAMAAGILIWGMTTSSPGSPYDIILEPEEIPGDWSVTDQSTQSISWDRQGGQLIVKRTYGWSEAQLRIELHQYFYEGRADRAFPQHLPPNGVTPIGVDLGDEGFHWVIGDGIRYMHFHEGGVLVYSWLEAGGNPDLDFDWFYEVMGLQQLIIGGR